MNKEISSVMISIHNKLNVLIVFVFMLLIMVGMIFGIYVSALLNTPQEESIQQLEGFDYVLVN